MREIPVLAAGKGWVAVNKPAGMSVHNDAGRDLCSRVSVLVRNEAVLRECVDADAGFGVHPVHRLDKETSGVILLALSRETFRFLSNQFEARQVKKRYVSLLHGLLEEPGVGGPWGIWEWALSASAGGRLNPQGSGKLLESCTRYRIMGQSLHYTMVELELLSGRTHQIRRHAKLSGHPVVGDARYGSARALNYLKRNHSFERLALHAQSLTLRFLSGQEPQTIETPTIPVQIQDLFEKDSMARE